MQAVFVKDWGAMKYERYENALDHTAEPSEWRQSRTSFAPELYNPSCKACLYSMAIHEASHAVLNEELGYKVISVRIDGGMRFAEAEKADDPSHIIIIAHAAYVGEIQIVNKRLAFEDANEDMLLINYHYTKEKLSRQELMRLYGRTEELVEQNWEKILAVADALANKRRLSGDEVREIMRRS